MKKNPDIITICAISELTHMRVECMYWDAEKIGSEDEKKKKKK